MMDDTLDSTADGDGMEFLGRGWSFPPRFSMGGATLTTVAGAEDIQQSLAILFATEQGERVMRPDFGGGLRPMLFAEVDQALLAELRTRITNAVLFHEPRITLERVEISQEAEIAGLLSIALTYVIRSTNSRYNLVFPFYVREATGLR